MWAFSSEPPLPWQPGPRNFGRNYIAGSATCCCCMCVYFGSKTELKPWSQAGTVFCPVVVVVEGPVLFLFFLQFCFNHPWHKESLPRHTFITRYSIILTAPWLDPNSFFCFLAKLSTFQQSLLKGLRPGLTQTREAGLVFDDSDWGSSSNPDLIHQKEGGQGRKSQ